MHRLAFELDQIVHGVPALFFRERARTDSEGEDRRYQFAPTRRRPTCPCGIVSQHPLFNFLHALQRFEAENDPHYQLRSKRREIDHRFQSGHHHGAFRRPHTPDR